MSKRLRTLAHPTKFRLIDHLWRISMKNIVLGFALVAMSLAGCSKDKSEGDKGGVTVPAADRVIPANFKNDRDEAGFKAKLPETTSVLESSTGNLSLKGSQATPKTKKLNVTRGLMLGFAKRLQIPADTRRSLSKSQGVRMWDSSYEDDTYDESLVTEGEDMFTTTQNLEVGNDCTSLLNQVSGQYEQAVQSYTQLVTVVGTTDFSQAKGFTKDGAEPTKEAFAYNVFLTKEDMGGAAGSDGDMNIKARFAGGANDQAVALTANGVFAISSASLAANIGTDLNTYADIAAKSMSLGVGIGFDASGSNDGEAYRGNGQINLTTTMTGGATPSQAVSVKGNFSDGNESHAGQTALSLKRDSVDVMSLDVLATVDGKSFTEKATMAITTESLGYETCKVTKVEKSEP